MSFIKLLKEQSEHSKEIVSELNLDKSSESQIAEAVQTSEKSAEQLLRDSGFKIKLITPTTFGIQIEFAKKYEEKLIQDALKNFKIKIKDKSVFIII